MANCSNNIEQSLVSQLSPTIFMNNMPFKTKVQLALKNVCTTKICTMDRLLRAVVCRILREKQVLDETDVPVLLMLALKNLSLETLDMSSTTISNLLASENKTENIVDMGTAVVSQMMSHLPKDISEFVSADMRLAVFKLFIHNIQIKEDFSMVPIDLINALQSQTSNLNIDRTLYNVLSPAIKDAKDRITVILPQDMDHIQFVEGDLSSITPKSTTALPNDMARTIEVNPNIMVGKDTQSGQVQYYYYDRNSGSLSDIQLNDDSIAIDPVKLENLLKTTNMSMDSIDSFLEKIAVNIPKTPSKEEPIIPTMTNNITKPPPNESKSSSSPNYIGLIVGIVVGVILLIALIVGIILYTRNRVEQT